MPKVNVLSRVLAVIGCIALSATAAHAGGGQGGGGTGFEGYQCYLINGVNQPRVVDLSDQFGDRKNVPVGSGRLLCAPVTGVLVDGSELDLFPADLVPDHFKCYDIPPFARLANGRIQLVDPNVVVKITDQFDVEVLKVHSPVLLCVFAVKERLTPP